MSDLESIEGALRTALSATPKPLNNIDGYAIVSSSKGRTRVMTRFVLTTVAAVLVVALVSLVYVGVRSGTDKQATPAASSSSTRPTVVRSTDPRDLIGSWDVVSLAASGNAPIVATLDLPLRFLPAGIAFGCSMTDAKFENAVIHISGPSTTTAQSSCPAPPEDQAKLLFQILKMDPIWYVAGEQLHIESPIGTATLERA